MKNCCFYIFEDNTIFQITRELITLTFIILNLVETCKYKQLEAVINHPRGNPVGIKSMSGSMQECEEKCDDIENCWSFIYRSNSSKCFFKDKKIFGSERIGGNDDLASVYKDCGLGMQNRLFQP